jgi:hypothetical protein
MQPDLRDKMVFHGVLVIVIGLLAGFFWTLVLWGLMDGSERQWRMAHLEGLLNGLLVLAIAAFTTHFRLSPRWHTRLAWLLILTAYANVLASILGAWWGVRGLTPFFPLTNTLVFLLFAVALITVLVALVVALNPAGDAREVNYR